MIYSQFNKPPRAAQSCGNCNAFEPMRGANPAAGQPRQGLCRAQSPLGIPVMGQASALSQQMVPLIQGGWPPTQSHLWCRVWESVEDDDGRNS